MTECISSPFYSCNLCFDPLSKCENISALTSLSKVVKSCIGPQGKLKLIQNSAGIHTTITSSSQRLFPSIAVKNSLSKLIISNAKSQIKAYNDGGLRCAFFTLSLIEHSSVYDIPLPLLATIYEYFIKSLSECFKSEDNLCSWKIDFSNLRPLQAVVQTLLSTKPGCLLSRSDKDYLCGLLLEAFLKIFPCTSTDNFNIRFLTSEGRDVKDSKLYDGLLIQVSKLDWTLLSNITSPSAKVALFTVSLSGDVDFPVQNLQISGTLSVSEAVLKYLQVIIRTLILERVDVVICQKVVHPSLKKQLNEAGIAVFDQLGGETAGYLQYMLGGSANSSLSMNLSFGTVACSKENIGKKYYILLHTDMYPFCSFLIYNYNEEALLELKVVCQQVITVLFQLLKSPRVCFGAGCTEIYTAIIFKKRIMNELHEISTKFGCTSSKVLSALRTFLLSITNIALSSHQGSRLDFVVETTHGHLWRLSNGNYPSKNDTCACGCYTASSVESPSWHFLSDLEHVSSNFNDTLSYDGPPAKPFILDVLDSKINMFLLGGEIATLLLKTNMCISCETSNSGGSFKTD